MLRSLPKRLLSPKEMDELMALCTSGKLRRAHLVTKLAKQQEFERIIKLYQHPSAPQQATKLTRSDIKHKVKALVMTNRPDDVLSLAREYSKYWYEYKQQMYDVVNQACGLMLTEKNERAAFRFWISLCQIIHGRLDFSASHELAQLLMRVSFPVIKSELGLCERQQQQQVLSTLISLYSTRNNNMCVQCFKLKENSGLSITSQDLSAVMYSYCKLGQFQKVVDVHEQYLSLHHDDQFDTLLVAHSKLADWAALQQQFDGLFNIGELPNIKQYGIVMYSLSCLGEIKNVEALFNQLRSRDLIPDAMILCSMVLAAYKVGDFQKMVSNFELFAKFGLKAPPIAYNWLLKMYSGMLDLDGALEVISEMMQTKITITHSHIHILIDLCGRLTNVIAAKEIYSLMSHFSLVPNNSTRACMMRMYVNSYQPADAVEIYNQTKNPDSEMDTALLTSYLALEDYTRCHNVIEKLLKGQPSRYAYTEIIRFFLKQGQVIEAEKLLLQKPTTNNYEVVISAYSDIGQHQRVLELFKKYEQDFPALQPTFKMIHCMVRASFTISIRNKRPLDVDMVQNIIDQRPNIHPSIVAYTLKTIARYDPGKTLKFKHDSLSILREQVIVHGQAEDWDNYKMFYDKFDSKLDCILNKPSATVKNKNLALMFAGVLPLELKRLTITDAAAIPSYVDRLLSRGFQLSNANWNDVVRFCLSDSRNVDYGLRIIEEKLIWGFNKVHSVRASLKNKARSTVGMELLHSVPVAPTLYITGETMFRCYSLMDLYLNDQLTRGNELSTLVKQLHSKYPRFMNVYMRKPRDGVAGWSMFEAVEKDFFKQVRALTNNV